ncbi:RNA exonuclease 1 homolog isoform X2 [Girardinichthys multiradiatus]|uniref:RNA exonuclease 1 homolog isoform X2 n=1 Tax=Girardinichthys multiradiatus TaxID=208333 RepID=UPI001FAE1CBD|nr:RNA exonuclease 1 homolog isoform X2 [Girardinichthys multiradiatus]
MFPSSGLFIHINCPFLRRGLCERPHCLYKHATESRETFGGLYKSAEVDLTGDYTPANDNSLHELERLDKEIETVRHEVEQEQRRLSCYQTSQADRISNKLVTRHETSASYGLSSSKEHKSRVQSKYVVDNSKPRTDLEYDPLSNFSAALRSYSSSGNEHKGKTRQDGTSSRSVHFGEKPSTHQVQMYQTQSPENLDDATEDGVLVIDVSLSPNGTSDQPQNTGDLASGKSSQDIEKDVKEIKTVKVFLDSPTQKIKTKVVNAASLAASSNNTNNVPDCCSKESNPVLPTFDKTKGYRNEGRSVVDLTGCLEELERESKNTVFQSPERVKKMTDSASFSTISDQPYHLGNPQIELTCNTEKTMSQPYPTSRLKRPAREQASITEQKQGKVQSHFSSVQSGPSVVQDGEETTSKTAVKTDMNTLKSQKRAEAGQASCQIQSQNVTSVNPHGRAESSESTEQLLQEDDEAVIIINSSSEDDDISYSEMDISDSDPMEECYRIFMEANCKDGGNEQCTTSMRADMVVEKPEVNRRTQTLTGKKRVAHKAKNLEPLAKSRPQPQVLVPLQEPAVSGFVSRPSISSKIQQVQQRASVLTAQVKAGQKLVSSVIQKKPETQTVPSALTPTPENFQPSPVQNAYLNYIPFGTAVVEVGNNMHLILPQGSFPLSVTSTSSPVASVLTTVSQVHPKPDTFKQTNAPAAVTPLPRYRSTAPVLIAAPARRPALNSAFASTSLQPTVGVSTGFQAAAQAAVKTLPVKRKLKQQSEGPKDKVPHDVRQRYVNMFTEEFLKTTADVNKAFEKALAEEKSVYNRSVNKLKYLSIAVNALKRLKNQSTTAKMEKRVQSQRPKGNIPFDPKKINRNGDTVLYEILKGYALTNEQMIENNYPVQHPENSGSVVLFSDKKVSTDPLKRICCRCGATYSVSETGKHVRKEECNYHYGKGVTNRVPGGVETRYSCCQGVMGAPGCQMFKLHVHDFVTRDGFVSTVPRCPPELSCPGVYSLDCEMCYTVQGLELSRVTVINSNLQVIYDTFVRPDNEVIDYNTRFSGISEEDVKGNHTSLSEVQETLLSFISADTILVGHGLETDLCLLKLLHGRVVDTSVVFPHRLGPPNKLSLNSLTAEYLRRIIQESGGLPLYKQLFYLFLYSQANKATIFIHYKR